MEPTSELTDAAPPTGHDTAGRPGAQQEVEVWWGGYAIRKMVPGLSVCLLTTLIIIGTEFYLRYYSLIEFELAHWVSYSLTATIWLVLVVRGGYRLAGSNYRLTTHRLFCDLGFFRHSLPPVDLAEVTAVRVVQTAFDSWLNAGNIVIEVEQSSQPQVLPGVAEPHQIASLIQREVLSRRERNAGTAGELAV